MLVPDVPCKEKLTFHSFLLLILGNLSLSHCCVGEVVTDDTILSVLSDLGHVEQDSCAS